METTIRPVRVEDAAQIYAIQLHPEVLPYIMPLPSLRLQDLEKRLGDLGRDMHYFVAEADGEVAGYAFLRRMDGRKAHCGYVALSVHPRWQRQGIGTALIRRLIELADDWLMLERVELVVLATNPGAQRLYERLGFTVEGRQRGANVSQGEMVDEILMARLRPGGLLARGALRQNMVD